MRAFPINGDSMPPHTDTSFIVGRYVENLAEIKKGKTYILVTVDEGITYKRLSSKNDSALLVAPDNIVYHPYQIKLSNILEIWEYVAHIGRDDSKQTFSESDEVKTMFGVLMEEIKKINPSS
jgi:hypothetical protein